MKPTRIFLSLLLIAGVVGDVSSQEDRAFFAVRPSTSNAPPTKGETFALLVGINKYYSTEINDLRFCVQDPNNRHNPLGNLGCNIEFTYDEAK